jgi:hypothetical protein
MADDTCRTGRAAPSAAQQNIEFELQSAESDLAILRQDLQPAQAPLPPNVAAVLTECARLLACARQASRSCGTQEVLIFQLLLEVRQNMLLVMPVEQLAAAWPAIRETSASADEKYTDGEARQADRDKIDAYFANPAQRLQVPEEWVRGRIKEFKTPIDDGAIDNIWRAVIIRQQTAAFSVVLLLLLGAFIYLAGYEIGGGDKFVWLLPLEPKEWPKTHSLVLCILAGLIGGCISSLTKLAPRDDKSDASGPPLVSISSARPVIGGAAGLVLWATMTMSGDAVHVGYPALYVAAVALGFSERLFLQGLADAAKQAEKKIGAATGLGAGQGKASK